MTTFIEKLNNLGQGDAPKTASLTFLSDLSSEDRDTFRRLWPKLPATRRMQIVEKLVTMAEDNIDLYFRRVYLVALEDEDADVRLAAIEGLFEDNSKLTLGMLIDILAGDPDDAVREAAASSLGRFTYLAQCDKLGNDAEKLRAVLVHAAGDPKEDSDVRRRAVESLGYLNGDAEVQQIISDTYRRGGRQAESAVFAMGRNMDPRWEQTILNELDSDLPAMRFEAARAAGETVLEDALPFLVRLVDDPDSEVRLAAVWALGQVGGRPAAEALARVLKSENPALREAAEEALQEVAFSANPLSVIAPAANIVPGLPPAMDDSP
jgi:HEAT repeat protein